MANSIEVRVPFLDHELMEYMFSLSSKCYYREGVNKVVLNNILKKVLPGNILNNPKKGFGYPLNRPRELEMVSNSVSDGRLVREGIVNSRLVNSYIEQKDTSKLWALYIFENWFQNWC
jgi:asparagine synthase (glutamine-hydrolysing)